MTLTRSRLLPITRIVAAGMAISGFLAVAIGFFGDVHWYADLFSHLRPQYCVWLGLAIIAATLARRWIALGVALAALIANCVALAPYSVPWHDSQAAQPCGRPWTFVTINLLYGNRQHSLVSEYLRREKADVVVFEEVSAYWQAELEELSDLYPYRSTKVAKDSFGIAIFSRQEPLKVAIRQVGEREGDVAVFGTWESDGKRFGLVGVHPDKPDDAWKVRNRRVYLGNVAQWCNDQTKAGRPLLAIGDFNATPWSASLRSFVRDTDLRNANQGTIFGATWNLWQPHRLLIDHVFLSPQWTLLHREVGPDIGSDHRPLLIRAALKL